jgi:alkaline phosphatase D
MASMKPDFAVFQGDMIYADNAIPPTKLIPTIVGGGVWRNNPSKNFVAVSLEEFRANWKYNFGDDKMQSFLSKIPVYVQWDDHEVTNNWYPSEIIGAPSYPNGTDVDGMYKNSLRAFYEFNPLVEDSLIYRSHRIGKHLEIFFVDLRSYRSTNPLAESPSLADMMGAEQLAWFIKSIRESTATWKIISNHDPLSIITGGPGDYDAYGQGQCKVLGREFEMVDFLRTIKDEAIPNVVYITSDVHYTASISYKTENAVFKDFIPFHEFVIGPIHSGAFGPNALDGSFGPEYEYIRAPGLDGLGLNLNPPNYQSFGYAEASETGNLTVKLIDITGKVLFKKIMSPQ